MNPSLQVLVAIVRAVVTTLLSLRLVGIRQGSAHRPLSAAAIGVRHRDARRARSDSGDCDVDGSSIGSPSASRQLDALALTNLAQPHEQGEHLAGADTLGVSVGMSRVASASWRKSSSAHRPWAHDRKTVASRRCTGTSRAAANSGRDFRTPRSGWL